MDNAYAQNWSFPATMDSLTMDDRVQKENSSRWDFPILIFKTSASAELWRYWVIFDQSNDGGPSFFKYTRRENLDTNRR